MTHRPDTEENAEASAPDALALVRLRKRADFVRTARGRRAALPGLVLQCHAAPETAPAGTARVGFTATKKLGNAVVRNRVKRRLRAAAAQVMPQRALAGHDYVLVGRSGTANRPFALLVQDLRAALHQVHRRERRGARAQGAARGREAARGGQRRSNAQQGR